MEARRRVQWSVAILLGVGAFCLPVFADQVYKYEGEFNLQIPDEPDTSKGWMVDAVIEIDFHLTILDIDVGITLTHSNVFDLQISLQGPDGTIISLNAYNPYNEFFQGADYSQTVFDDEAQTSISQAQPPFTGRFRPDAGNCWKFLTARTLMALGASKSTMPIITTPAPWKALSLPSRPRNQPQWHC